MTEGTDGWTVQTLKDHFDALRAADQRALAIKEAADRDALTLAREIQAYRDEQANNLRAQIERERVQQATKEDVVGLQERFESSLKALTDRYEVAHKPIADYVAGQLGRREGVSAVQALLLSVAMLAVAIVTAVILYDSSHHATPAPVVVTVTTPAP